MKIFIDGKSIQENKIMQEYISNSSNGEQHIKDGTELGEALKELNNDDIPENKRMSGIDMRSILGEIEISSILAVDTLVSFNFLPISCLPFTRQKKRLMASKNGIGREQIVKIISGKREGDQSVGASLFSGAKNMFGGNK